MSQTIDDRIVQLEFDNDQFEKNVNESLKTLQQLKSSLDLEGSAKNLTALTDASKKVDFSHLSESIDSLNEKFSTMRMVGMMALSNIVDGAMNAAKKLGSFLTAPINQMASGGWARAANLEQANFMMEGFLHDSNKVAEVMKNVDEAVSGTAYSLDEAAKAAAQFAVSGVAAGEDMTGTLKAVAGTAAMTGASFAEISDIFTTVASNGKLTKMQLNQLSFRGMNAAAVMAEYFETTEAEIRDLVHKGEISFEMFSEAMESAFGEHAKDANNTFQGALANMKSALNRIGAEFAKPIMRDAIPVFNSLRLMINSMKANLGEVIWIFDKLSHALSTKLVSGINRITEFLKSDSFKNNGLKDLNEAFGRMVISVIKIGKAISEAFHTVFNGSLGDHINNLCKGINTITKVLKPTETGLLGFKNILIVVFSVVKKIGQVVGFVITKVGGPLLKAIVNIVKALFSLVAIISRVIGVIGDFIRENQIFERIIFTVESIIYEIVNRFDDFKKQLSDTSTTVGKVAAAISKAFNTIKVIILTVLALPIITLYKVFEKLRSLDFTKLIDALINFKDLIIEAFEYIKELPIVKGIIEGIQYAFMGLIGVVYLVVTAIQDFINKLAEGEITLESIRQKILDIPNSIKRITAKIKSFFEGNTILSKALDFLSNIGGHLKKAFANIKKSFQDLTPAKAMLLAFAMSMLTMSLIFNKLGITIDRVIQSASINLGILKVKLNGGVFQIDKYTAFASALAEALLALTAAFYILGKYVPKIKEVAITLGSFIAAMVGLGVITMIVEKLTDATLGFRSFVWNMAIMATSIASIALAMKLLSDVSLEGIAPKLGILAGIMTALIGVSFVISKFGDKATFKAVVLLVAYAASVVAVCVALRALDGINLSGIKGTWPELLAILTGVAAVAVLVGKISSILIGSVALLALVALFVYKLYDLGAFTANKTKEIETLFKTFKENVIKIINSLSDAIHYIWNGIMDLDLVGKLALISAALIAIPLIIFALVKVFKYVGKGFILISKEGKYIRKVGSTFLMFAAGIAALIYVSKLLGDWIKENPNIEKAIVYIMGILAVCTLFSALSFFGDSKVIKAASKAILSLSIVILAMGAFAVMVGTLKEDEFQRAVKTLQAAIVAIGVIVAIIGICSAISKKTPAGFGMFAGITMLFAAMIGSLAWLMMTLKEPEDYARMYLSILAIGMLFAAIAGLMDGIGKIHTGKSWAPIAALFGGLVTIGLVITHAVKTLPDEHYIGKVATMVIAMVALLAAIVTISLLMQKINKSTKVSITKTSSKNLRATFTMMAELIVGILAIAGAFALVKDVDPKQMALSALIITVTLAALGGIAIAFQKFTKGMTLVNAGACALLLGSMVAMFTILAVVMKVLAETNVNYTEMFWKAQMVSLILLELAIVAGGLGYLAGQMALGLVGVAALAILTVLFAALAFTIAKLDEAITDPLEMLKKAEVVALILLELAVVAAGLGALAAFTSLGLIGVAALAILTACFVALAFTIKSIQDLDVEGVMPKIQMIEGVLSYLGQLLAQFASLSMGAIGMVAGSVAVIAIVGAINLLVNALREINDLGIDNVSAGLEQISVALGMLTEAGKGLAALGGGLIVLAIGIVAVGVACLAAAPGIIAFGLAFGAAGVAIGAGLNVIAAGLERFIEILSRIKQTIANFFDDVKNAFTNNPAVQMASKGAELAGDLIGKAFGDGFRKPVDWNSPPGIITNFLSDAASAFTNSPAAQACINAAKKIADFISKGFEKVFRDNLGWHSWPTLIRFFLGDGADAFINSMEANGFVTAAGEEAGRVTKKFGDIFEDFDIGSITKQFGLDGILGLTDGVKSGESSYETELGNVLGFTNMWASQMSDALARGYGTLSDFQYQLNDAAAAAKVKYDKAYDWAEYWNRISPNSQAAKNATKNATELYNSWQELKGAAERGGKAIDELTEEEEEYTTTTGKATSATKDFVTSLADTLANQLNIFSKFEQKNPMNKDELLNNMKSQIKGMTDWANNMNKLATMGIDQGLYKKLAEMGPQGAEYVGAFVQMSAEELGMANELWAESLVLPGAVANQIGANFESMGENTLIGYQNGLDAQTNATLAQLGVIAQEGVDTFKGVLGIHSPSTVFIHIAENCMYALIYGFESMRFNVCNTLADICQNIVEIAEYNLDPDKFKTIGINVIQGLIEGFGDQEMIKELKKSVEGLAVLAEEAMQYKLEINSPSKVFARMGSAIPEGMAKGINDNTNMVVSSVHDMADDAVSQMKSTIASISQMINDEMEDPVITPVLDLSKVQAGARLLNSTFSANAAIAAGGSQLGALQNGQYSQGGMQFIQNNYSPKALSRIDIYRDTRNMLSQFKQATT